METKEYIESGMLELYVYGTLNESEIKIIQELEKSNNAVKNEIISIENAILNLTSSFSPAISVELFEKIRAKLFYKSDSKVVPLNAAKPAAANYLGWAAAAVLMLGTGYFYNQNSTAKNNLAAVEQTKTKLQESVLSLELKNQNATAALTVLKSESTLVINLAGQAVSPKSFAKVYWNKTSKAVFIDATGLPAPPKGMVYQVWALKLNPLTPTNVGLLTDFTANSSKIFAVENNTTAEGFGITLEPAGGSKSPTMEQLYTLGTII